MTPTSEMLNFQSYLGGKKTVQHRPRILHLTCETCAFTLCSSIRNTAKEFDHIFIEAVQNTMHELKKEFSALMYLFLYSFYLFKHCQ